MSFRVPTANVSVVDLTCTLEKGASYADIMAALQVRPTDAPPTLNGHLTDTQRTSGWSRHIAALLAPRNLG